MFEWNDLVEMFYEIVNGGVEGGQIIFYHIPDHVVVDVEVAVGYAVAHALDGMPGNLRAGMEQQLCSLFVDSLDTLADGLYQHAVGCQGLYSVGRREHLPQVYVGVVPCLKVMDRFAYLTEGVLCDSKLLYRY